MIYGHKNVEKCKVVHYGRDNIGYNYSLYGQTLADVESEKDLGVVFSNDLKVGIHSRTAYSKASQSLGLIHRIIKFKNLRILIPLYKSMVRPHLEYCTVIWSPHNVKDKHLLERVQHRFIRMFPELKTLPYDERLKKLGLWSLEERRNRADLLEVFKMVKGFSAVSWSQFFTRSHVTNTRGHNWKLQKKQSQSSIFFLSPDGTVFARK